MEFNRWKNILLDWVINTGFLQPSFSILEDTNLDAFYREYRTKITANCANDESVQGFLKNTFPEFSFHFFDDEGLCSAEFVYVYSLLLQYGCVQCRNQAIQNSCKQLTEQQQVAVANFFKHFAPLKNGSVTRSALKRIIKESMAVEFNVSDSPVGTPNKRLGIGGSPNTPKNRQLEMQLRELNRTRLQLEAERYEKGFLEIQIRDGEEQIRRLSDQQRQYLNEIHTLKNQLLYENDENKAPNVDRDGKEESNAVKRNIAQLEDKVANLLIETHCLEADKNTLNNKLKHSNDEVCDLLGRNQKLIGLTEELKYTVQEKEQLISELQDTNSQLNTLLSELKGTSNATDLDSTSDFSFSKPSDYQLGDVSGNLAKSVIDIQLKETQIENEHLRVDLEQMKEKHRAMEQEMLDFLQENDLKLPTADAEDQDKTELLLDHLLKTYNDAIADYEVARGQMVANLNDMVRQKEELQRELQKHSEDIQHKCEELGRLYDEMEQAREQDHEERKSLAAEMEDLKNNCNALTTDNDTLRAETRGFQMMIKTLEEDIFIKVNELRELNLKHERQSDKNNKLKYEIENSNRAVAELHKELASKKLELDAVRNQNDDLLKHSKAMEVELKENIETLQKEIENKTNTVSELDEMLKKQTENISIIEEVTVALNEDVLAKTKCIANLEERFNLQLEEKLKVETAFAHKCEEFEGKLVELQQLTMAIDEEKKRILDLEAEQGSLVQRLREAEKNIEDHLRGLVEKDQMIGQMQSNLNENDVEIKKQMDQIESLVTELEAVKTGKVDAEKHLIELEEEIKESVIMMANQEEQITSYNALVETMKAAADDLQHSLDETHMTVTGLEAELGSTKAENNELAMNLANANDAIHSRDVKLKELQEIVQAKEGQCVDLEQAVTALREDIDNKSTNISNLQSEVTTIRETIEELDKTITNLNDELQEKVNDLESSAAEISILEGVLAECRSEIGELNQDNERKAAEVVQMEETIRNLEQENVSNVAKIVQLGQEINSNQQQLQEYTDKVIQSNVEKEGLEKELSEMAKLLVEREEQLKEMNENAGTQRETIENLESQLKESESMIIDLTDNVNAAQADCEEQLVQIQSLSKEIEKLNEQTVGKIETITSLTREVADKTNKVTHMEVMMDEMKALNEEMDKNIQDLHEKLFGKATEIVNLETKLEETLATITEHKAMIEENNEIVTVKDEKMQKLRQDLEHFENNNKQILLEKQACLDEINVLQTENTEKDVKLKESANYSNTLESDKLALNEQLAQLRSQLNELESTNKAKVSELQEQKEQFEKVMASLESFEISTTALNDKIAEGQSKVDQLTTEMDQLIKAKDAVEQELSQQNTFVAQLREEKQELEQNVAKITEEKETVVNDVKTMQAENEMQEQAIDQLRSELTEAVDKNKVLKIEMDQKEAEIARIVVQMNTVLQHNDELQKGAKKMSDDISAKAEAFTELEDRFKALEVDDLERQQQLATMADEVKISTAEITNLNAKIVDLGERIRLKQEETAQLEEQMREIETVKTTTAKECQQLQQEIEAVKVEAKEKQLDLENQLKTVSDAEKELQAKVERFAVEVEEKQTNIDQLMERMEEMNQVALRAAEEYAKNVSEVERTKTQTINGLEKELQMLRESGTTTANLIVKLTSRNQVVEHQLEECERKLNDTAIRVQSLITDAEREREEHEQEMSDVKAERKGLFEMNKQHELKMVELSAELVDRERRISLLMTDLHKNELGQMEESSKINMLLKKLETYKTDEVKLQSLEQLHHREKEINQKLTTDVEILCAKLAKNRKETEEKEKAWQLEKAQLLEVKTSGEQKAEARIKDYRHEMEGKLEKMKEKMKTLYNEEMGKLKGKHERDVLEMRKELATRQHQVEEYEAHTRKLSQQIRQLNERQLEFYKENELMKNRMKSMDCLDAGGSSIGSGRTPADLLNGPRRKMLPPSSSMLSVANLKMEDEEGELFNNTYLIDLKNGRTQHGTSPGRESVCLSELQHRNSLAPRHLRSTYSVQYGDQGYREEDLLHVRNGGQPHPPS